MCGSARITCQIAKIFLISQYSVHWKICWMGKTATWPQTQLKRKDHAKDVHVSRSGHLHEKRFDQILYMNVQIKVIIWPLESTKLAKWLFMQLPNYKPLSWGRQEKRELAQGLLLGVCIPSIAKCTRWYGQLKLQTTKLKFMERSLPLQ